MILKLKAKHFRGTKYYSDSCAIGKAIAAYWEQNRIKCVGVGLETVHIQYKTEGYARLYVHHFKPYHRLHFVWDKFVSFFCSGEKVIRKINIPGLELKTKADPELSAFTVDDILLVDHIENELKIPL